jgi:hypothetical protein
MNEQFWQAERRQRPFEREPDRKSGDEGGPSKPDIQKPGGPNELLKRMKKVDPDQAKKYRQRSGQ